MAIDVSTTGKDCHKCVLYKLSEKCVRPQQLFPTSAPLEIVAIDILKLQPKALDGNQSV